MNVWLALLLAWALERAELLITMYNYGSTVNGFGAMEGVWTGATPAPAAYRILVPGLMAMLPKNHWTLFYQILKILGIALMFWAVANVWDSTVAIATGILAVATFLYDYWDWSIEIACVALAMTGRFELALAASILHATTKETAPVTPFVYFLTTGDLMLSGVLMGIVGATLLSVRMVVGLRSLYCERFMWKQNWKLLKGLVKETPVFHSSVFISVVYTVLGLIAFALHPVGPAFVIPVILAAGWLMAKADETRVFSIVLPFIAKMVLG